MGIFHMAAAMSMADNTPPPPDPDPPGLSLASASPGYGSYTCTGALCELGKSITATGAQMIASGGTPPYSYLWSAPSGFTAGSPTSASCSFTATVDRGASLGDWAWCTVTDATNATASQGTYVEVVYNWTP